jgi:hypothetical protein
VLSLVELRAQQPAVPADRAASAQCLDPPAGQARYQRCALCRGDTEPVCDRRRGQAQGEQVGGNQPTALQDGLLGAKLSSRDNNMWVSCTHAASL